MTEILKAMSDPTRRQILFSLRDTELTAGDIAAKFEQTGATISHHLSVLKDADLVRVRRNGTQLIYSISTSVLEDLMASLLEFIPNKTTSSETPE